MLQHKQLKVLCPLRHQVLQIVEHTISHFTLFRRVYPRMLKVARMILDLAGSEQLQTSPLSEAIGYRRLNTAY